MDRNKDDTNNENDKDDDQKFRTVGPRNRRKAKFIPVTISPGEGEKDDDDNIPSVSWAKTTYRRQPKKPKVQVPEATVRQFPEIENNNENTNYPNNLTKEGKKLMLRIMEDSNTKIGFSPITNGMIKTELERIRQKGIIDVPKEYNKAMIQATKNSIMTFMKKQLKMDEKSRNAVRILKIYPSQNDNNIIYIKCQSQDDIAMITGSAKNLPRTNYEDDPPTLVPHVPKELYTRYQDIEKLLWQIRKTELGKTSTNIRLGRLDYLIRYKSKQDPTNWKDIPPINILGNISDPEIDY